MEKNYAAIYNCYFCNGPAGVAIDRRLKKSLPLNIGVIDKKPCATCAGYMKKGVILISVKDGESGENPYRTGGWVGVTTDFIERVTSPPAAHEILKRRSAFIEDSIWKMLGLPEFKKPEPETIETGRGATDQETGE